MIFIKSRKTNNKHAHKKSTKINKIQNHPTTTTNSE